MSSNTRIIISVAGGVVQDVFVSDPGIEVVLVDWDVAETEMEHPAMVRLNDTEGNRLAGVVISQFPVNGWDTLPGTDVATIVRAAGVSMDTN